MQLVLTSNPIFRSALEKNSAYHQVSMEVRAKVNLTFPLQKEGKPKFQTYPFTSLKGTKKDQDRLFATKLPHIETIVPNKTLTSVVEMAYRKLDQHLHP